MTGMTLLPNFPQLIGSIYPAQTASSRAPVSHLSSQTGKEGSAGLPEHTAKMPSWEEMEERLLLTAAGTASLERPGTGRARCDPAAVCFNPDSGIPAKVQVPPRELNLSTRAPSRAAC